VNFEPSTSNFPFFAHPFSTVCDLDSSAINSNNDRIRIEKIRVTQRSIQLLNTAKYGSIVGWFKTRDIFREFSDEPFHLAIGQIQAEMETSHPFNESDRILKWAPMLAFIHGI
jgi:hypothetical protein